MVVVEPILMMNVRVADLTNFDAHIDLPPFQKIADLKAIVRDQFSIDTTHCLVFLNQREMRDSDPIEGDCLFYVFYDQKVYGERSYPTVEGALQLDRPRFASLPNSPPEFPLDAMRPRQPNLHGRSFEEGSDYDILGSEDEMPDDFDFDFDGDPDVAMLREIAVRGSALFLTNSDDIATDDLLDGDLLEGDLTLLDDDGHEEELRPRPEDGGLEEFTVALTPEEIEVIRRLSRLGFHPHVVVQVWDACGRDERLTEECLMSGGFR
jgi:hypothetical protein